LVSKNITHFLQEALSEWIANNSRKRKGTNRVVIALEKIAGTVRTHAKTVLKELRELFPGGKLVSVLV
jgi:hypothetical protein